MRRLVPAALLAVIALALSLRSTAARGWSHHEEWQGDVYTGLALRGFSRCQLFAPPKGDCVPTAYRLPVYPLILRVWIDGFGGDPGARVFQSVIACLIVFLSVALTARFVDWRGQLVTGAVLLSSSSLYYFAGMLVTETLYTFLVLLLAIGVVRWQWR